MAARLWTAPGVHLARVREDIVLLDVPADRYDCLVDAAAHIELGAGGELNIDDAAMRQDLVAVGIAATAPPPEPRAPLNPALRDLPISSRASTGETLRAGIILAAGSLAFRGKSLSALIAPEPATSSFTGSRDELRMAALVAAARRARPWIPYEGECLMRSFQLRRLFARHDMPTDWVFGVRTWPFSAHCWLQVDDLVIGDRLDRVSLYTPIMRV